MQPNEEAAPVSQDPMHKGHPVDVTFENYSAEHVNRYTAHMNAIREQCPVAWSDGHWSPKDTGFWLLTSYAKVREAGLNYRLFTTEQGANPMQQDLDVYRMVPLENDPPLHTRIRAVLTPFFVPAALDALDDQIRAIVVELIERASRRARSIWSRSSRSCCRRGCSSSCSWARIPRRFSGSSN